MAFEDSTIQPQQNTVAQKPTPRDDIEMRKKTAQQPFPGVQHWLNLVGTLKTVTTIPTGIPKSLADSMVIYLDSLTTPTVQRLYVFSDAAGLWLYVALT